LINAKLQTLRQSLQKDFGIDKPKIAVLGMNPHAGDNGTIGKEEELILKPTIDTLFQQGHLVFGPYSADAFFARGSYQEFDAVLAMYHDQGLVAFKTIAQGEGVNYTAGLSKVRTSPDHGTAFDIAGKNEADPNSFREALFSAIDILQQREAYATNTANPLRKAKIEVERGVV
jgi:4-hydroxythreonine-4-phosphate dehydrogenase